MLGLIGKKELHANSMFTTARKLRDLYHYDVMGGGGGEREALYRKFTCSFCTFMFKIYMKVQKHAHFHVFLYLVLFPPLPLSHHSSKGSIMYFCIFSI